MIATQFRAPLAHGAGRYFDGIGSLALARPESRYEGQIALEWNVVADPAEEGRYGYEIDRQLLPWTIDLRPMVREVVHDLLAGVAVPAISARFHNTMVAATAQVVRAAAEMHGTLPVVLTGGCFQNPRLAEGLAGALSSAFIVVCTLAYRQRACVGTGVVADVLRARLMVNRDEGSSVILG
jgi:hydrogenase maturation protein HypF